MDHAEARGPWGGIVGVADPWDLGLFTTGREVVQY